MRLSSIIVGLVASLVLVGCGGGNREAAKAPETNPWADYKGTYAPGGPEAASTAEAKPASAVESKPARTADARPKPAKTDAKPRPAPADAKAMYGVASETKPEEDAAPPPRKAAAKKRGKGGARKAPRAKS